MVECGEGAGGVGKEEGRWGWYLWGRGGCEESCEKSWHAFIEKMDGRMRKVDGGWYLYENVEFVFDRISGRHLMTTQDSNSYSRGRSPTFDLPYLYLTPCTLSSSPHRPFA